MGDVGPGFTKAVRWSSLALPLRCWVHALKTNGQNQYGRTRGIAFLMSMISSSFITHDPTSTQQFIRSHAAPSGATGGCLYYFCHTCSSTPQEL